MSRNMQLQLLPAKKGNGTNRDHDTHPQECGYDNVKDYLEKYVLYKLATCIDRHPKLTIDLHFYTVPSNHSG